MDDNTPRVIAVFEPDPTMEFALPANFRLEQFPSLERVEVTRNGDRCHVVTRWLAVPNVEDEIIRLSSGGLGRRLWRESVTETHQQVRRSALWMLLRPWVLVPSLIGFLGGLEALRHHHAWLLAPAEIAALPAKPTFDVLASAPSEVAWETRNIASFGECQLRAKEAKLSLANGAVAAAAIPLRPELANWSKPIAAGEGRTETFHLPPLSPGWHDLKIVHTVKAGFLRGNGEQPSSARVRAWKSSEFVRGAVRPEGAQCALWLELHVGRAFPGGARFDVKLIGFDGLAIDLTDFIRLPAAYAGEAASTGAGQNAVAVQRVTLPPLAAFTTHPFRVLLSAKNSIPDWQTLCNHLVENLRLTPL